jgi:hypothetical protein
MPTKAELVINLNDNNRVIAEKDRLLKEQLARHDQTKAELDALQEEFDKYQESTEKATFGNANDIRLEMLALVRMESPVYAIAYAEAALAEFPALPDDNTVDLSRVPPSQSVLREFG